MTVVQDILNFWFGQNLDDLEIIKKYGKLWFGKDKQVDREIKQRFEPNVEWVGENGLLAGDEPLEERYLATILLLDQFTRNIYRGRAESFARDSIALSLALNALNQGLDSKVSAVRKVFFYLPLEHSEEIVNQNRSVQLFQQLLNEAPSELKETCVGFLDYAIRHQEIIVRFGRFPHRNEILGRVSTAEELEFLEQPNSSF